MLSRNRGLRFELDDLREELAALRTELAAVQVRARRSCKSAGALRPRGLIPETEVEEQNSRPESASG